jgi:aminopeptidase N
VETVETVVDPVLDLALRAVHEWAPDAQRAELEAQLTTTARHLVDSGTSRQSALRVLARTASGTDEVDRLRDEAGDDVDLQWYLLQRRAELGDLDADAVRALEDRDPDPDAWVRALRVRASSPSAEAKEEAWNAVVVERTVPIQSARLVGADFWRPGQDEVLTPYLDRYLEALPTFHEGGMIPGLALTASLFPVYAVDEAWVARAREVAAAQAAPVVISALTERSEEVLRMVRARGL